MSSLIRNPLDDAAQDVEMSKALSLVNQNNNLSVKIMSLQEDIRAGKNVFFGTLPSETRNDRLAIMRLNQRKVNDIESLCEAKEPFEVHHFILSTATFVNKDNEVVVSPKLVLIGKDEVKSVLAGVFIDEFLDLVKIMGCPSPDEPYLISAKLNKGNGVNRYYSMVLS